MPENRFGGVNQQPLYNVTGRMERGEAPQQSKFQSPTAGVQKDFSASNMPNNAQGTQGGFAQNLMESVRWGQGPLNMYGRSGGGGGGRRGKRGGGGGGDGDGSTDSSINIDFGNFTGFGEGSGNTYNQQGLGGNNDKSFTSGGTPAEPASGAATAQPTNEGTNPAGEKRKRIVTDEQKARRKDTDQKNKSGERTPVPRGPRTKPAAVAPAAASTTTTTTNTNNATIQANPVDNRSVTGHTANIGRSGQPVAAQGAGQPGNAPITFGGVKGATVNGPASIGATKVGRK